MAVVRVEHTENYSIISNVGLREKGLSLRAKGLLCVMLSLPKDWDYSLFGLSVLCGESEGKIKTTLNELKQFGYVEVKKLMPNETESGRIEYEYIVYEMPKQESKKQALENQGVVFQAVENERLPNNNIYNTNIKEQRTNKQIKEKVYITDEVETSENSTTQPPFVNSTEKQTTTAVATLEQISKWFDLTYAIYPRKVSKELSRRYYVDALIGMNYDEARKKAIGIYKMLQTQCELWKKEHNGQGRADEFIPHFSSWLSDNVPDSPYCIKPRKRRKK